MPLADSRGPAWLRESIVSRGTHKPVGLLTSAGRFLAGLLGARRLPRSPAGPEDGESGASGAGSRSPLIPPTPALTGSAARRLEETEEPEMLPAHAGRRGVEPGMGRILSGASRWVKGLAPGDLGETGRVGPAIRTHGVPSEL
jgi:hypothetical protein